LTFTVDYFAARSRFRAGTLRLGWELEAHSIPARGPDGQELTVDVAISPGSHADRALVISSGLHGVEGFVGSALQSAVLEGWSESLSPTCVRLVFIHALNPFGFCWIRRCDEDNVDPNRNFLLPTELYEGSHSTYRILERWLNPRENTWSRWDLFPFPVMFEGWRRGNQDLREAVAGGQYDFPKGLFYGGSQASTAMLLLEANLRRWLEGCSRILHLDVHTGLGPWATYKLLVDRPVSSAQAAWLRNSFGREAVQECHGSGIAYPTRGSLGRWCTSQCADTDYSYLCLEFGTYSVLQVLNGLRAENHAHHWKGQRSSSSREVKRRLLEVFCPTSSGWRRRTLRQGSAVVKQALAALDVHQSISPVQSSVRSRKTIEP
jgi:hypothetical protein